MLTALYGEGEVQADSTFVETFEAGSNEGSWPGTDVASGGNAGAYRRSLWLDPPELGTAFGGTSEFTGDYRAMGVTSVGVDVITLVSEYLNTNRPLTVLLQTDNGTPGNGNDDWEAYWIGPTVPEVGEGWKSFSFLIPSLETSLPAGWGFLSLGQFAPPDPDWNTLITHVSRLEFYYNDPAWGWYEQLRIVGLDNPRITKAGAADGPGSVPSLTIARASGAQLQLSWEPSSCSGASDYAVYQGALGQWTSHAALSCAVGALTFTFNPAPGDAYYLVVPVNASAEGSYGLDSSLNERPQAQEPCRAVQDLDCP